MLEKSDSEIKFKNIYNASRQILWEKIESNEIGSVVKFCCYSLCCYNGNKHFDV